MMNEIKQVICPIHKEGYPFIAIFAVVTLLLALVSSFLGWIGTFLTLWCVYFFRNPNRVTPTRDGLIVSPADGRILPVTQVVPPAELEMGETPLTRVSIFMNVLDVHINRIPIAGKVSKLHYHAGKFLNASMDKASEDNERQLIKVTTEAGKEIGFVQIAGLVARRIVCVLREGDLVQTGERFGMIRFGSRVDIYLPEGVSPLAVEGQRAVGGETVIADLNSDEPAREGLER